MSLAVSTVSAKNEQERVLALLRQLDENSRAFAETGLGFPELQQSIAQMENLVFSFDGDEAGATAVFEGLAPTNLADVNYAYHLWEITLELEFVDRLVRGEASLSDYFLYKRSEGLVRRELALIAGSSLLRILFVGTGPLPMSAIHAHLQTGASVDCAGRDEQSVAAARQVLEACGLQRSVRTFSDDGTEHDLSPYDLVVIEVQTRSGSSILKRLRKRCKPGCQILYRTAHGLRRLIYPGSLDSSPRGFHVKGWQIAQGEQTVSTCLLEAATSAAADVNLSWLQAVDSERALQILRLMNRTLEEETTIGFPGPIDDETGIVLMGQLDADIKAGRRHVLVAEKDGVVVGQVILTPNSTPNHHHIVDLTRGTIDRSFRGAGLALRAFQEVVHKCEELGREVICLDVRAGTNAAIWWQHFGFRPYGILEDYSRVGDKKYAGLFLTQTTADLKQHVREIARARPVTASLTTYQ
jgi:ribosomal protein S18 acetylase RimI-like enzyme